VTLTQPEPSLPEPEIVPPAGIQLEHPASGGVRVRLQLGAGNRALLAVPRLALLAAAVGVLLQAWRHHVYIGFWLFGVPFLPWVLGSGVSTLLIGERALEVEARHSFGRTLTLPRSRISRIEVNRAGLLHSMQRALYVHTTEGQTARLLVGLNAAQAEFVHEGLQRWLASDD